MDHNLSNREKKFVQDMLLKLEKKDKSEAYSAKDVDQKEVENITDSIRRKIQRGE